MSRPDAVGLNVLVEELLNRMLVEQISSAEGGKVRLVLAGELVLEGDDAEGVRALQRVWAGEEEESGTTEREGAT